MSDRLLAIALGLALAFLLHGCGAPDQPPALVTSVQAAELPDGSPAASRRYREALTGYARYSFGMDAPVPVFGGQVEQESGWAADARSGVGASGIGQFMPGTATDVARKHPESFGSCATSRPAVGVARHGDLRQRSLRRDHCRDRL